MTKTLLTIIASPAFSGALLAQSGMEESAPGFFQSVKSAGFWMLPIIFLGLAGLTLIIERALHFIRSGSANRQKFTRHLETVSAARPDLTPEEREILLQEATQLHVNRMEKGLTLMSGIGNLAPLLGFFGTVVGMIKAFAAIASASTINAKVVAVGIQLALVTTAGGLTVAAPVLAFYYFYSHLVSRIWSHSDEVIARLCRGTIPEDKL